MNEEKFEKWCATQSFPDYGRREDRVRWFRDQCRHDIGSIELKEHSGGSSAPCMECADCGTGIATVNNNVSSFMFIRALVLECKSLRARLDAQQKQIDELKGKL